MTTFTDPQAGVALVGRLADRFRLHEAGLEVIGNPTYSEYEEALQVLGRVHNGVQFAIGDGLLSAERSLGETYAQLEDRLGYDPGTLSNMVNVAKHVPLPRRRPSLSWSHHKVVAYLDPPIADELLARAESDGWSVKVLTEAKAKYNRALKAGADTAEPVLSQNSDKPPRGGRSNRDREPDTPAGGPVDAAELPDVGKLDAKTASTAENPVDPNYDPDEDAPDPIAEWERAEKENEALREEVESLRRALEAEGATEILRLREELANQRQRQSHMQGRLDEAMNERRAAVKRAKYLAGICEQAARTLKVDSFGDILAAIHDLMR